MRSKVTRRSKVALSASGEGCRPSFSSFASDKVINRRACPGLLFDGRQIRALRRNKCPMRFPLCARIDPVLDRLDLSWRELAARIGRRHAHRLIRIADFQIHLAVRPNRRERMTPGFPNAPSFVSKCRPAMRCFSSGPWQVKQLSERMGLT